MKRSSLKSKFQTKDDFFNGFGNRRKTWLVVFHKKFKDNLILTSNFEVIYKKLHSLDSKNVKIEYFKSLNGVNEGVYIIINPNVKVLVELANTLIEEIKIYPLLDESHYSELEHKELDNYIHSLSQDELLSIEVEWKQSKYKDQFENVNEYIFNMSYHIQN